MLGAALFVLGMNIVRASGNMEDNWHLGVTGIVIGSLFPIALHWLIIHGVSPKADIVQREKGGGNAGVC